MEKPLDVMLNAVVRQGRIGQPQEVWIYREGVVPSDQVFIPCPGFQLGLQPSGDGRINGVYSP